MLTSWQILSYNDGSFSMCKLVYNIHGFFKGMSINYVVHLIKAQAQSFCFATHLVEQFH
jgi:hypothetical protein